jgi:hypothetical protein
MTRTANTPASISVTATSPATKDRRQLIFFQMDRATVASRTI